MEFTNFVKVLGSIGYELNQTQTYLDEYEFIVTNPMDQFQDGIRLMKIAEICANDIAASQMKPPTSLISKLKVPANSYSHCLSNINLALGEFESMFGKNFLKAVGGINANHFFNGDMDKIYSFIWQLFLHWKLPDLLDCSLLEAEIKKLKLIFQIPSKAISTTLYFDSRPIQLLLKWCKVIGYQFQRTGSSLWSINTSIDLQHSCSKSIRKKERSASRCSHQCTQQDIQIFIFHSYGECKNLQTFFASNRLISRCI